MRQKDDSGILSLATAVRDAMSKPPAESLPFVAPPTPDVKLINGMELQDHLEAAFASAGEEGAMLITRSNKRANLFNKEVRARVLFREDDINAGDLIMVVKNNYHWLGPESKAGFIANGDVLEVLRLGRRENRFGFNFVNATVRMIDYPDEPDTEVMLWLNAIDTEGPSMGAADQNTLYTGVLETYADLKTKEERRKALRTDPFYNALQIKFAYAVTCHKAQGGQWPVVFIDQGYMTDEMLDIEYLRWLYTAITRAREKLFLLNFSDAVFEQE
jgi:exodeoxyribonuclease-5